MARGKKYQAIKKTVPTEKVSVADGVAFLKNNAAATFDETVEVHVNLGVDPSKSDQMVRGSVTLPSGSAKQKRIVVFTADTAAGQDAMSKGATLVGGKDLIDQIAEKGSLEADVTIASPDMMPHVAKVAKILGPKGLMPNPKTGTVTPDVAAAVADLAGGKVSFKMDQLGNIHESVAKLSWEADKITDNAEALIDSIRTSRPAGQKGEYIRSITITTTMGPGVKLQTR